MLQQLREAGLTANPVKCELHWLNYLGHIVGNEKVYPGKNKVQAAEKLLTSKDQEADAGTLY